MTPRKTATSVLVLLVFSTLFFFAVAAFVESSAWAKAGGGGSSGSRGSRSLSTPSMPSSPSPGSPGISNPGRNPLPGSASQPSSGFFGRSPFLQGMAGGLAGGLLGSMLFGGMGHAASGGMTGGGMGFLDIALIGLLLYVAWRFFKRRRDQAVAAGGYSARTFSEADAYREPHSSQRDSIYELNPPAGGVERGSHQLRQNDSGLSDEALKDALQDAFFRIQAAWMNRSLEGVEEIVTEEMADYFSAEFETMRRKGRINRLENIAVRKVELSEAWQEAGKDYVTVLFTANLLDYTIDEKTGGIVGGDKLSPVKFQEFWTFCRDFGSPRWKLSGINQVEDAPALSR